MPLISPFSSHATYFFYDLLCTPFFWQIATFSLCSTPLCLLQTFSLSFPIRLSPVLLSLVFSPHVSITVCSYSFTVSAYAFVCSGALTRGHVVFFLLHPPTPLILNFFREWPVPFYSPFASYQQSLRAILEGGNLYSQCCLLLSHLILLLLLFLCTETLHIHTFLLLFLCTRLMSFVNHTFLAITCHVLEWIPTVSVGKSTS